MHSWSTSMLIEIQLLLLHSTFMLSGVKMPLKGEVGGHTCHGIVMEIALLIMENHGKIMELCF